MDARVKAKTHTYGADQNYERRRFYRSQLIEVLYYHKVEHTGPIARRIGVSEETFDRWIDGLEVPSPEQVQRIAMVLPPYLLIGVEFFYQPPLLRRDVEAHTVIFDFPEPGANVVDAEYVREYYAGWTDFPPFEDLGIETPPIRTVPESPHDSGAEVLLELEAAIFGDVRGRSKDEIIRRIREEQPDVRERR